MPLRHAGGLRPPKRTPAESGGWGNYCAKQTAERRCFSTAPGAAGSR
jgi:hypothetical protein